MPILKFRKKESNVILEKLRMEDITDDKRTLLLDKSAFICSKYRIDEGVYIAKNDLFFKMANLLNKSRKLIDAILIRENNTYIIIVPCKSYVFWNGRSVEPENYHITQTAQNKQLQNKIASGIIPTITKV